MGATAARAARRRAAREGRSQNHLPLFGIAAAVVAGLFVVAILSSSDETSDRSGNESLQQTAAVSVSGASLAELSGGSDSAVGATVPEVTGETFTGDPISIHNDGTPKAILFVAHWCPHCQVEVPKIQQWLDGGGDTHGVEIVTISTAVDEGQPNFPPSDWLAAEGWTAPVLVDDEGGTAAGAFGVSGYPFFVFVDDQGKVTARTSGEIPVEQFESFLAGAASGI